MSDPHVKIDAEYLAGHRFPYQEDISLIDDVDLIAATPGEDINWLEDVTLLEEDGVPAVFDRYSNSFLKLYFPIPTGREDEIARKVLVNSLPIRFVTYDALYRHLAHQLHNYQRLAKPGEATGPDEPGGS